MFCYQSIVLWRAHCTKHPCTPPPPSDSHISTPPVPPSKFNQLIHKHGHAETFGKFLGQLALPLLYTSFSVAYSLTATDGERRLERVPRSLTPGYNPVTLGCSPGLSFNWIRQIFKGKPIWKYSPPQTWEFLFQLFRGTEGIKGEAQKIRPGAPRLWI